MAILPPVQASIVEHGTASSATLNSAWTTTTGNLIVGAMSVWQGTAANQVMSGSVHGTETLIGSAGIASNVQASMHYKANATGGTENLTANGGTGAAGVTGVFHEVSGADTAAPFTAGEVNVVSYTGNPTNPQTNSVTNSVPDSIFFAFVCNDASGNPVTLTVNSTGSTPTGWALKDAAKSQELNGATAMDFSMPYRIVSSSAATKHGWTTNANNGVKGIAAFKAAAAAAWTRSLPSFVPIQV